MKYLRYLWRLFVWKAECDLDPFGNHPVPTLEREVTDAVEEVAREVW